jgi:hypothetical protein
MGERKDYEESPTLDPNAVRERAGKESYLYQYLSWDAHPSIKTLNRYYVPPNADGWPGINLAPVAREAEVIELLNLMCLAVIGVFLGVADLSGKDYAATRTMAAEYKTLTERTREMNGLDLGPRAGVTRGK